MSTRKAPRIDLYCRNADGEIVIVSKVWWAFSKTHGAISLYVARGAKHKVFRCNVRKPFAKDTHSKELLESMRDTLAHLWAMEHGVSDYVIVYREPHPSTLFHPTEMRSQFSQENQNVV